MIGIKVQKYWCFFCLFQSIETCAVCSRCSRVSKNPKVCDRCGAYLSEDSATACYSSQPKQVVTTEAGNRPESRTIPLSVTEVNGGEAFFPLQSISQSSGVSIRSMDGSNTLAPQPVPQALYVNSNTLALRPQTVYLNMTNSIQQQQSAVPVTSVINQTPQAMVINSSAVNSLPTGTVVASSANVRPGPPALVPVTVNSSANRTPGQPPPYPGSGQPAPPPLQSQQQTAVPPSDAGSNIGLSVEVHQIRVGTRKFMPASSVAFKDDGVLFTLRGENDMLL